MRRRVSAVTGMSLLVASVGVFAAPAGYAAGTSPCTDGTTPTPTSTIACTTPGTVTLSVTPGTTSMLVDMRGGGGAGGTVSTGGSGGSVYGNVSLPTGTAKLAVTVGAGGAANDFFFTGPQGGGGTAVVALSSSNAILAKLAIAGGGGGGGGGDAEVAGTGGNAGVAGGTAIPGVSNGGGPGSGGTGGAAGAGSNDFGASGAGASDDPSSVVPAAGGGGGEGLGGAISSRGGGGGGGLAGGGGGGAGNDDYYGSAGRSSGGGGGGGSSYVSPSYSLAVPGNAGVNAAAGDAGADGYVNITIGSATGPPSAPATISAVAGNAQATVTFSVPASDGGAAVTSYTVTSTPGNVTKTCSASPCTVTGLTNGTAYTFTVKATNTYGTSVASSASNSVTPANVPGPPTAVSAVAGNGQATVTFTAPVSDGGSAITGYTATSSPGAQTGTCLTSPCVVPGLTNGTSYTFTVIATNAIGNSVPSTASTAVTPIGPSAAPSITATPGDEQITVSFTAPSNGGSAITGYQISLNAGGSWQSLTTTTTGSSVSGTVGSLTNGQTYQVQVRALNAAGNGAASNTAAATPATVPDPPANVTASSGNAQSVVTFTAPSDNGGSAITSYTVTSSPGGLTATCPGSPCTVTGLTNGTSYTFSVVSTNAIGDSQPAASIAVTPLTTPAAPVVTATPGDERLTVAFTAPANGGSDITGYEISLDGGLNWQTLDYFALNDAISGEVTGLTNGTTYQVKVRALNIRGNGAGSTTQPVVPAGIPDAPTAVSAVSGNTQATVTFTPPVDNGGSAITSYTVTSSPGSFTKTCSASPCTVAGLTNGTSYTFTVVATNSRGDSLPSQASSAVVPATTPSAPDVTATPGDEQITVSFEAPDNGGSAITGYEISVDNGGTWETLETTASNGTLMGVKTGLTNGTEYPVTVRALNSRGNGDASLTQTATPAAVPDAPTAVSAVAGDGQATISFSPPVDNGGSVITGYTVTSSPDGKTVDCSASPCIITDLTNGTSYTFTVVATNAIGDSDPSAATSAVTPIGEPGVAGDLAVTGRTSSSLTVSFTAPDDGGSAITGYEISTDGGVNWQALTVTGTGTLTGTVAGLEASTTYPLKVRATNAAGTSEASATVSGTTRPATLVAPTATAGIASVTVTWAASTDPSVTGYTVTASPGPATCESTSINDTSCVIGATAGVEYTYTVVAHSPNGDSDSSAATGAATATAPVVPATVPLGAAKTLTTTDGMLTSVDPGQDITVVGTGFAPYSSVTIILYSDPVVLATPVTDANGAFSQPVTIPNDIEAGTHNLVASGVDTNGDVRLIRMQVTVSALAPVVPIPVEPIPAEPVVLVPVDAPISGNDNPLPYTGAPLESLLLWATVATAFGLGLVRFSRRRKTG